MNKLEKDVHPDESTIFTWLARFASSGGKNIEKFET